MGTCCAAHLTTKIRDYAPNAENGAVTVQIVENPAAYSGYNFESGVLPCDYCKAPAEFIVSYFPKKAA